MQDSQFLTDKQFVVFMPQDAIFHVTVDGTFSSWNEGAKALYGYQTGEVLGKPFSILQPAGRYTQKDRIDAVIQKGDNITHVEDVQITKDGRPIGVSLSFSPIKDAAGRIVGTACIARDISGYTQETLRENEERYRAFFQASRDAVFVADAATGMLVDANPAATVLLGRSLEEIRGLHQTNLHAAEDTHLVHALFERRRHEPGIDKFLMVRSDGKRIPVEVSSNHMRDTRGRELVFRIFRDVTERERADAALRESEERFRIMADSCPAGIWVSDEHGHTQFVNRAYRRFLRNGRRPNRPRRMALADSP